MRQLRAALAGALLAIAASAAQSAVPANCQSSDLFELARQPTGARRDFDGDGVPDQLRAQDESGSAFSSTQVELRLSTLSRTLRIRNGAAFESLLNFTEIPKELQGPSRRAARDAVAAALYDTVCSAPEASLTWLLDGRTLRWQNGPPQQPDNYIIESANVVIAPPRSGRWPEADVQPPRTPVWIGYLGVNHRRSAQNSDLSADLKVLAERPGQQLLGTAHGVVLMDTLRQRHAWLYVQAGGQKLRWPTISAARFDGARAVITVQLDVAMRIGSLAVDLASGKVTSTFCDVEAWNASSQTCG